MRSPRVLAVPLVLLILVPAGILGWLGIQGTDRYVAEMRQRIEQEMDVVAEAASRLTFEFAFDQALDVKIRTTAAAELLSRRLPFEPVGRALAEAKSVLCVGASSGPEAGAGFDRLWEPLGVELRILDASARPILPALFDPDRPAKGRTDPDRLFDDLAREADALAFGKNDLSRAVAVWKSASDRVTEPAWKARAQIEVALLTVALARPPPATEALVADLEARFQPAVLASVGRPWVLLLLRAAPTGIAIARLQALEVEGSLAEVPLTEQERARVREWIDARAVPDSTQPDGGHDAHRVSLPGGLVLEVLRRWPSLEAGPAGVLLDRWRSGLPAVARAELSAAPPPPRDPVRPFPITVSLTVPRPGGPPAWAILRHGDESRLLADVEVSRRWTIVGVLSLVGVMGLGLLVGRSVLAREREARRLKDDFLANVSHELRTPLTSVCLHADLLAESGLPEAKRRAHAEVVRAEGARLSALVDDLLDFAALERGSRRLEPEPVDLDTATSRALAPFRVLAAGEGVALSVDLVPGELVALADSHALDRILSNLVGNAWKHGRPSRDGGPGCIVVRVAFDGVRPAVDVVDDGPGIPWIERPRLFERFQRGAGAGRTRGVGLGLALSRELARAMGGDLAVVDDPAHTVFRLTLPPAPPSEVPA